MRISEESGLATRVFLVRHGETEWNAQRRIQGHTDTALSARGVAQAECVAGRLADEPVAAVYSSDLRRAFQTAEAIASRHGLRVVPEVGLREVSFGEWEGKTEEDRAAASRSAQLWRGPATAPGESIPPYCSALKVFDRVVAAHTGQTAVTSVGGSMRAVLAHALGMAGDGAALRRTTPRLADRGGDLAGVAATTAPGFSNE